MVMLAFDGAALEHQFAVFVGVHTGHDGFAQVFVVKRLLADAHAHTAGLRGAGLVNGGVGQRRSHGQGGDVKLIDGVHLVRCVGGQLCRTGRAVVDVVDFIQIDRAAPVGLVAVARIVAPVLARRAL